MEGITGIIATSSTICHHTLSVAGLAASGFSKFVFLPCGILKVIKTDHISIFYFYVCIKCGTSVFYVPVSCTFVIFFVNFPFQSSYISIFILLSLHLEVTWQ